MQVKVSDLIAQFLKDKNIKHVFGIVGAGNAHIFDSIDRLGFTQIISVHHEQTAVMAAGTYFRTGGIVTAAIVTTGGGSTNAVTGVVSTWMDSAPCLIISGNEKSIHTTASNPLRIWGVQGYDSTAMVEKVTKYSARVSKPTNVIYELEKSYFLASGARPGPCWLDVPMDIQATKFELADQQQFIAPQQLTFLSNTKVTTLNDGIETILSLLKHARRPLFWLGHGIRLAGAQDKIISLLDAAQVPALVTWQGMDMVESEHALVFGRAGVYGQRASNFILQNCDLLICIGTRMAYPQVGYDINELARSAKIIVVDIDQDELDKFSSRIDLPICADAKIFISKLLDKLGDSPVNNYCQWLDQCCKYQKRYPVIDKEHQDTNGYINSYQFMHRLSADMLTDQHIVTDMGTALLSGHQILSLKQEQRIMTSTGLGEMGFALPAAIGVSFARNKGQVLCLNCDGGMMMNLQELQTIVHHDLPIKIIIFNNDGYLMIKHTQKNLFNNNLVCTDKATGVSCPDFSKIAAAFNLVAYQIRTWADYSAVMLDFLHSDSAAICEVFMDPEQFSYPKVGTFIQENGSLVSPPLEDMLPFVERKKMKADMLIGMHPKSEQISD